VIIESKDDVGGPSLNSNSTASTPVIQSVNDFGNIDPPTLLENSTQELVPVEIQIPLSNGVVIAAKTWGRSASEDEGSRVVIAVHGWVR
jgi:hypothetical protein